MENKIRRGRGRPKKEESRKYFCGIRLDEEEAEMLKHLTIELDVGSSDIFRNALKMYYNYMIGRL